MKFRPELRVGDICRWHKNLFHRYDLPINQDGSYYLKRDILVVLETPYSQEGISQLKMFHIRKGEPSKVILVNRRDLWFTGKNAYNPKKKKLQAGIVLNSQSDVHVPRFM
jgi:hypothetical protein